MKNTNSGLTDRQVTASRQQHGANVLPVRTGRTLDILRSVLLEPMLLLLAVACSLYFFTGQYQEGFILSGAMAVVVGISLFQEFRSENALKALRQLILPKVTVLRDGSEQEIPSADLVVGDRVKISEGEQVPADGRLDEFEDLSVNEALLTGESLPVYKCTSDTALYAGTTVLGGWGWFEVDAVGAATRLGRLGKSMERVEAGRTPLHTQIRKFVRWMAAFGALAFLIVCVLHYVSTGDWLHSLFHGLTLAMAALPEEIPVAVSTFMALGAYRMMRKRVLVRDVKAVEALGSATVICVDKTGTITQNRMVLAESWVIEEESGQKVKEMLAMARLACESVVFDPMEKAIEQECLKSMLEPVNFNMIRSYPLSGKYPLMTHVYVQPDGSRLFASKGAPEGVIALASLSEDEKETIAAQVARMAAKGFRVLAVGSARVPADHPLPEQQESMTLGFDGLVAFSDPIKTNIPDVLEKFRIAGINVKMITGDHPSTACHVAAVSGFEHPNRFLTGSQVNEMSAEELQAAVSETDVFARSMPETKLHLIHVLKSAGGIVAMTGDGVNDAPALKAANIGVSMGKRGSEVARQASALVLLDDDLSAMVTAIEQGRRIHDNLRKAIRYIVSIHLPILLLVLVPLLAGWEFASLFSPIHIIFLELVMGPTCSIVFESEPAEEDLMRRPPSAYSGNLLSWHHLRSSVYRGGAISIAMLLLMFCATTMEYQEVYVRTLVFTALCCSNIFLTLSSRSDSVPVWEIWRRKNPLSLAVIGLTLVILGTALFWPPLTAVFGLCRPSILDLTLSVVVGMVSVIWWDLLKAVKRD